jgi:hypothetical protein
MLHPKIKMQFVKQESNMQHAIVLLNNLKHIAPQQLMLRTQVFTKNFAKKRNCNFINKVFLSKDYSYLQKIQTSSSDYQVLDLTVTL